MIQRIQTLFLTVALLLIGLLFWFPLAEIVAGEKIYSFTMKGIVDIQSRQTLFSGWHIVILLSTIILLQLVVIFSYKTRIRQMKLTIINLVLMIGFAVVGWFFVRSSLHSIGEGIYTLKIMLAVPLVAALLNYLAFRAILKDEKLVRSVDRIR